MSRPDWRGPLQGYLPLDPEVARLAEQARWDLYYGASDDEDYPGFERACIRLRAAADDFPSELWFDNDAGYVTDTRPPEDEEEGEWYALGRKEILQALFGDELAKYL